MNFCTGTFNRAIAQSGTCFSPWALQKDPMTVAWDVAKLAGFKGQDKEELVKYLKILPGKKLVKVVTKIYEDLKRV